MSIRRSCLLGCGTILSIFIICQITIFRSSHHEIEEGMWAPSRGYYRSNSSRQFPSALIIGVRKGGTRALLDALALHPKIRIVRRELHYFDQNFDEGLEWYKSNMPFANPDQIVIEKTPGYFTSAVAPSRVVQLNYGMKIILIVRDPVQRTISDFTQVYYNKLEQNKTLPVFEYEVFNRFTKELNLDYKPVRNSIYHMHLANWLKFFERSQILLVNGDVFRGNPLRELRRVEAFLDLEPEIKQEQLVFKPEKGFFCFQKSKGTSVKCLGSSKGRPHRNVSQEAIEMLREKLRPHNSKFFRMVNQIFMW